MNDFTMLAIAFGVVFVAGIILFSLVRGISDSLSNAKVGQVYNFEYEQPLHGEPQRVLAKVIEPVYTLDDTAIKRLNRRSAYRRNDPVFQRTHHLVTCQTANGEIRQFYAERARNVRRSILGNLVLKTGVASLLF